MKYVSWLAYTSEGRNKGQLSNIQCHIREIKSFHYIPSSTLLSSYSTYNSRCIYTLLNALLLSIRRCITPSE